MGPEEIIHRFMQYYKTLYSTRVDYGMVELDNYLNGVEVPTLSQEASDRLEQEISLEEVQITMSQLQSGKTPGADGIPVEFYSTYQELLALRFTRLLGELSRGGSLPDSMSEAVIVLVPKTGKDPEDCASYCPISLINADAKLLAKVLANRLTQVLDELIHVDQTGFMPGKGTEINLRRLFLNMSTTHDNIDSRVIASLDAEKAFDSVEWGYLWEVLGRYGFGAQFLKWLKLLYQSPTACIRTNGRISESFLLQQGMRQGCPLSPFLFALALKPLAILLRASQRVVGLRIGPLEEKVSLYADDTLFYLQDADSSLRSALVLFDEFGRFSGVRINWSKLVLFPLDNTSRDRAAPTPLKWVDTFKYLGVYIHSDLHKFYELNVSPVLEQLKARCASWGILPLNLLGRINLIKMVFLPKFIYLFRNSPIWLRSSFF